MNTNICGLMSWHSPGSIREDSQRHCLSSTPHDEFTFLLGCIHRVLVSLTDSVTTACQKMHHCIFLIRSSGLCICCVCMTTVWGLFSILVYRARTWSIRPSTGYRICRPWFHQVLPSAYSFHGRMSNNSKFRLTCSKINELCGKLLQYNSLFFLVNFMPRMHK